MIIHRLLYLTFALSALAQAESRVFVSLAGTLLEAEIAEVSGDNVTLKRTTDGQTLVVNRRTLCKEDHAYIDRWAAENPGMASAPAPEQPGPPAVFQKFTLSCQTLPSKSNRGAADGGIRTIELSYNFNINNREVQRDLQGARGLVITLGKNAAESGGDLIVLQREVFDVAIRAQSKMVYSTQPVRLTYNQGVGNPYGVKSYGYVLIISDANGNILFTEASPDSGAKYTKEILAFGEVPCVVDRDFKIRSKSELPMAYISF